MKAGVDWGYHLRVVWTPGVLATTFLKDIVIFGLAAEWISHKGWKQMACSLNLQNAKPPAPGGGGESNPLSKSKCEGMQPQALSSRAPVQPPSPKELIAR